MSAFAIRSRTSFSISDCALRVLSTAATISQRLTSLLLTIGDDEVDSAQATSLAEAKVGSCSRVNEGDGERIACRACDHLLPLLDLGVICGGGEAGDPRMGLIGGDSVKARTSLARREGDAACEGVDGGDAGDGMCSSSARVASSGGAGDTTSGAADGMCRGSTGRA